MKEQTIEEELINKLQSLKYSYRPEITGLKALEANFREKFNALNKVTLTDNEFSRLKEQIITNDTFHAAKLLREINTLERDDGTPLHYTLVNIKDWCKNTFEVINQLKINSDYSHHRYDVMLLLNGLPLVQIELKTLTITPRRAMQQIVDYKNDAGNGYGKTLLCFLQLFIVSNKSDTWYFANNNKKHFAFDADERFLPIYQFATPDNKKVTHLDDFADKFLEKCTLGEMISRYMVLVATEQKLLMMRPYQIYAVKMIVESIKQNRGNGYIWHTTGSGKTLTSFKASTLLKDNPDIEKCLFVVDRKDLDRQTREEFNKFQEKCVEENANTETLVKRLLSDDYANKVIVTTIQKLGRALDNEKDYKERLSPLQGKRIAFIFDECHRSQFGENHKAIKEFFPKAQLFGFTGTPIFDGNASYKQIDGQDASYKTTADVFENQLHAYTITHAIEDKNVLKFHIDYFETKDGNLPSKKAIVESIVSKHDAATNNRKFNAVFATSSINDAIQYYALLKDTNLNIACVFSPPADGNVDVKQLQEDLVQEREDNKIDPDKKKAALARIIQDYNGKFNTNHTIYEFDGYYQDVQKRIKDQQYPNSDLPHAQKIDIVIVVDMLLTGFDSKFLNTLYVDKNLKNHGLIQAFSRTNRVLNDSKPYGNILDFRGQQEEVNAAIKLFSGAAGERSKEIWLVEPAPLVIELIHKAVKKLEAYLYSHGLENTPSDVLNLKGDAAKAQFMGHFKEVQRLKTQLDQYTDLSEEQKQTIETIVPKDTLQGFKGVYLGLAEEFKKKQDNKKELPSPDVAQLDFELVLFASSIIDYDYIMALIANYTGEQPERQDMRRDELLKIIQSEAKFMGESEDLIDYINALPKNEALNKDTIVKGFEDYKAKKDRAELNALGVKHGLDAASLHAFVDEILRRKVFDGEDLTTLLAPLGLKWKERVARELALMEDLVPYLKLKAKGRDISGLNAYE